MFVPLAVGAQDAAKAVAGGGITAKGWTGKIDASEEKAGQTLNNAKLAQEGNGPQGHHGPGGRVLESRQQGRRQLHGEGDVHRGEVHGPERSPAPVRHRHRRQRPRHAQQSYLYCAAYGNGNFIVRGFGPEAFAVNGRRGEPNRRRQQGGGPGKPVTQEIAVSVKGDKVECAINGTVVGSYDKATLVTAGKLKSTDGVYGIRFGHNTEATVTGLTMTKN